MTKNFFMMLGGGMLLALSACGEGEPNGWCDATADDDPDCLLDGACAATDCLDAGTCTMEQTAACWESGDPQSEACLVGDIQLDPGDPDCEECDFDESIDGCIVCPDPTDTTDDTCCDLANAPGWCDPFEPASFFINGIFAYDAENDAGRGFNIPTMDGNVEQPAWMQVVLIDERFRSTQNPAYACSLAASTAEGSTIPYNGGQNYSVNTQDENGNFSELPYDWFSVTYESGSFTTADYNYNFGSIGQIQSCNDEAVYLDPATFPDGIGPLVEAGSWTFYVGTASPIIEDYVSTDTSGLYEGGFLGGAAMSKEGVEQDGTLIRMPYYYTLAQAVDDSFVPAEDGEGDPVYVPASDYTPAEGLEEPARGLYQVTTPYTFGAGGWLGFE